MAHDTPRKLTFTRREASEWLSLSTRKLDDLASSGELPKVKIGRKTLFRLSDLESWIASQIEPSTTEVK